MTPEAEAYLANARESLSDAVYLMQGGRRKAAARAAYYAGFQAALAFIFDHTGRAVKTHSGARSEFSRLTTNAPAFTLEDRRFLGQTYALKNAADYATGPAAHVSAEEASRAIARAKHLVDAVESALFEAPGPIVEDGGNP